MPNAKNVKTVAHPGGGFYLVSTSPNALTEYQKRMVNKDARFDHDPPESGVNLAPVKMCPPAHDAFDAFELEARIAHYRARAEARLPLFSAGQPAPAEGKVVCWGCGLPSPNGQRVDTVPGWLRVPTGVRKFAAYCPACAAGACEVA